MDSLPFLTDLALVIAAAAVAGVLCDRIRIPRVLGYVVAGICLGPHTPLFVVRSPETIQTLGSLGLIFLMLSLGMRFNPARLFRAGYGPLIVALLDVLFMLWLGWMIGRAFGWGSVERLFLGAVLCDSSTVVLAKWLEERSDGPEGEGRLAAFVVAVTVIEDLLTIGVIALLNGLALQRTVQADLVARRVYELAVFLAAVVVFGFLLVPRFLRQVERIRQEETLLLAMAGLGFLVTYIAQRLQLSLALGAFVIGAVIGESPRAARRREPLFRPLQYLFTPLFFVYIGLSLDPSLWVPQIPRILLLSLLTVLGKATINTATGLGVGLPPAQALRAGVRLAQVCEFALLVGAMGVSLHVFPPSFLGVSTGVVLVTLLLNPLVARMAERAIPVMAQRLPDSWIERIRQYSGWLGWMGRHRLDSAVGRVVRRSFWTILLNLLLVAAVFGLATWASRWPDLFPWMPSGWGGPSTVFWLLAMIVSLPMYITVIRKAHALAMLAAELSVPSPSGRRWVYSLRQAIANVITSLSVAGLGVIVFLLSSALWPSWPVVAVSVLLLAAVMWRGWYALGRLYGEWQQILRSEEEEL